MKNKEQQKEIEKKLYEYKFLDIKIENIDLEIEMLMNDVSCARVAYEYTGCPTNSFSSVVENEVVRRDDYVMNVIEELENKKNKVIIMKKQITNALNRLNKEEMKLVELRYFDKEKMSWVEISMNLGANLSTCHRIKNRIITKLTDQIA